MIKVYLLDDTRTLTSPRVLQIRVAGSFFLITHERDHDHRQAASRLYGKMLTRRKQVPLMTGVQLSRMR